MYVVRSWIFSFKYLHPNLSISFLQKYASILQSGYSDSQYVTASLEKWTCVGVDGRKEQRWSQLIAEVQEKDDWDIESTSPKYSELKMCKEKEVQ